MLASKQLRRYFKLHRASVKSKISWQSDAFRSVSYFPVAERETEFLTLPQLHADASFWLLKQLSRLVFCNFCFKDIFTEQIFTWCVADRFALKVLQLSIFLKIFVWDTEKREKHSKHGQLNNLVFLLGFFENNVLILIEVLLHKCNVFSTTWK